MSRLLAAFVPALLAGAIPAIVPSPALAQEQTASAPKQSFASVRIAGDWWAPDFNEIWRFTPDPNGGVVARSMRRSRTAARGFTMHLDPSADGKKLLSRDQQPADFIRFEDELGEVHFVRMFRGRDGFGSQNLRLQRAGGPSRNEARMQALLGRWTTDGGTLTLHEKDGMVEGRLMRPSRSGEPTLIRRFLFVYAAGLTEDERIIGAWAGADTDHGAEAFVSLSADKATLYIRESQLIGREKAWSARRAGDSGTSQSQPSPVPSPAPAPAPPQPSTGGGSAPAPSTGGAPAPAAGFETIGGYEVRVERVAGAQDQARTDVFMTLRNGTGRVLYVTSGALQVTLEDMDGVGAQNGQVLRPTDEGREHFAATPALQPGREIRVKYSFHTSKGAQPARVLVSDGKTTREFGV